MRRGRVAAVDGDVVDWNRQPIGRDLGEAGLLALAVRRNARGDGHLARELNLDTAPFPAARSHDLRRAQSADLNVSGDADTEEPAGLPGPVSLSQKRLPAGQALRLFERALVVSAVVGQPCRGVERKLPRLRHVLEPHRDRVEAELVSDDVHNALDCVSGLRTSCATVGVSRHLVRVNTDHVHPHALDFVATAQHEAGQRRDGRCQELKIGPEVGDGVRSDGQHHAVLLDPDLVGSDLVPAVDGRGGVLSTCFDPLHGCAQPSRQVADE